MHAGKIRADRNGSHSGKRETGERNAQPREGLNRHTQKMQVSTWLAVCGLQDFGRRIGNEAFIQPRLLEFVVAHQPVPELMAEFMDGYAFRAEFILPRPEVRPSDKECRIFHARGV